MSGSTFYKLKNEQTKLGITKARPKMDNYEKHCRNHNYSQFDFRHVISSVGYLSNYLQYFTLLGKFICIYISQWKTKENWSHCNVLKFHSHHFAIYLPLITTTCSWQDHEKNEFMDWSFICNCISTWSKCVSSRNKKDANDSFFSFTISLRSICNGNNNIYFNSWIPFQRNLKTCKLLFTSAWINGFKQFA